MSLFLELQLERGFMLKVQRLQVESGRDEGGQCGRPDAAQRVLCSVWLHGGLDAAQRAPAVARAVPLLALRLLHLPTGQLVRRTRLVPSCNNLGVRHSSPLARMCMLRELLAGVMADEERECRGMDREEVECVTGCDVCASGAVIAHSHADFAKPASYAFSSAACKEIQARTPDRATLQALKKCILSAATADHVPYRASSGV